MEFSFSEFKSLHLGDARLDARLRSQMEKMMKAPSASVQSACSGWTETMAAYRLFNNPKVTLEKIFKPHRVLKTGCKIEHLRFEDYEAFEPALACNMIVAWRLQYLVHLGRECPELPCSSVFAEEEWRAALAVDRKIADPRTLAEPSLGELLRVIARFGGHLGRKNDAPPGAQCMWTGLARVRDFAIAIQVCRDDA